MSWYWCTYHGNVATVSESGELRCPDGDDTYGGHCTCVGPFSSKEDAENSEHARLSRGLNPHLTNPVRMPTITGGFHAVGNSEVVTHANILARWPFA